MLDCAILPVETKIGRLTVSGPNQAVSLLLWELVSLITLSWTAMAALCALDQSSAAKCIILPFNLIVLTQWPSIS
jgi:hypothetical protein